MRSLINKLRKQIHSKLHNTEGATFSELLVAMIILLLVTSIVAEGIPVAKNAYAKVVNRSNADLLVSTTLNTIRTELDLASDVELDGKKVKAYCNSSSGRWKNIANDGENGLKVVEFSGVDFNPSSDKIEHELVSVQAQTKELYTTIDSIEYDSKKEIFTIKNLQVKQTKGTATTEDDTVIASCDEYNIIAYNVDKAQ